MEDYRAQIDKGAAALVKGGVVCDPVTGDVLHDHDWTPMEAAEAVLEAVNHRGAVEALEEIVAYDAVADDDGYLDALALQDKAKAALAALRGR